MIERDPEGAQATDYDLIVVGGGIHGVMVALEGSRRGYRTLLLERGDFGGETTANSLRIVHGGLRYLQSLDFRRFFESAAERRWYLGRFPDLVRPLPCLLPLYGHGTQRPSILRLALAANDFLSRRRNRGLPSDARIPPGRVLTPEETVELAPDLPRGGLRGGALWYDASVDDAPRLVMEILRRAASGGARCLNYVEARGLEIRDGAVEGVEAFDLVNGEPRAYKTTRVVNCAGPWARELAAEFDRDIPRLFLPSLAFNLLLGRAPISHVPIAVSPPRKGSRTYFLRPWRGRILAGTYHAPRRVDELEPSPRPEEVAAFLSDLEMAVPKLDLDMNDVLRIDWGLLPVKRAGTVRLATRGVILEHGRHGGPHGLLSVSGVKLTTARRVAERALRRAFDRASSGPPAEDDRRPEPFPVPTVEAFLDLAAQEPGKAQVWVDRIVSEESVVCVEDLLYRRTDWSEEPEAFSRALETVAKLATGLPFSPLPAGERSGDGVSRRFAVER